jgi:hypothetical protein
MGRPPNPQFSASSYLVTHLKPLETLSPQKARAHHPCGHRDRDRCCRPGDKHPRCSPAAAVALHLWPHRSLFHVASLRHHLHAGQVRTVPLLILRSPIGRQVRARDLRTPVILVPHLLDDRSLLTWLLFQRHVYAVHEISPANLVSTLLLVVLFSALHELVCCCRSYFRVADACLGIWHAGSESKRAILDVASILNHEETYTQQFTTLFTVLVEKRITFWKQTVQE